MSETDFLLPDCLSNLLKVHVGKSDQGLDQLIFSEIFNII